MFSLFHVFLFLHIAAGTVCLVTGAVAMSAKKRRGRHTSFGEVYHGAYVCLFVSAVVTSVMHWSDDAYLFYIALFSYGLALVGYLARKIRWRGWLGAHISGMLGSYIGVVTAVLVVNTPHIAGVRQIPALIFWFLPTIVGTPLIARTVARYTQKKSTSTAVEQ